MGQPPSLRDFIRDMYQIWISEKLNQLVAALVYFGMFSFGPVIYIAYRLAGIFVNEAAAGERLYTRIEAVLGPETAAFIRESVSAISAADPGGSLIISIVSCITLLLAAMGLFVLLTYVLNRIWGVPLIRTGKNVAVIRQRLFAFVMVIALVHKRLKAAVVFDPVGRVNIHHCTCPAILSFSSSESITIKPSPAISRLLQLCWRCSLRSITTRKVRMPFTTQSRVEISTGTRCPSAPINCSSMC